MKKMKGVMAAAGVATSPYPVYEDQKARLKHQSLLQDYEELEKVIIKLVPLGFYLFS